MKSGNFRWFIKQETVDLAEHRNSKSRDEQGHQGFEER